MCHLGPLLLPRTRRQPYSFSRATCYWMIWIKKWRGRTSTYGKYANRVIRNLFGGWAGKVSFAEMARYDRTLSAYRALGVGLVTQAWVESTWEGNFCELAAVPETHEGENWDTKTEEWKEVAETSRLWIQRADFNSGESLNARTPAVVFREKSCAVASYCHFSDTRRKAQTSARILPVIRSDLLAVYVGHGKLLSYNASS